MVGYVAVWAVFGLAINLVAHLFDLRGSQLAVAAGLLVVAAWELTPWKRRALRACYATIPLAPRGLKADMACVRFGIRNGLVCVQGCWTLMAAMLVAGDLSLWLMAGVALVVALEKLLVRDRRVRVTTAMAALAAAAVVAANL